MLIYVYKNHHGFNRLCSSSGHDPADLSVFYSGGSPGFRGGGPGPAHGQQVQQSGGAHPGERRLEVVGLPACLSRLAPSVVQSDLAFSFSPPRTVTCQTPRPLLCSSFLLSHLTFSPELSGGLSCCCRDLSFPTHTLLTFVRLFSNNQIISPICLWVFFFFFPLIC